MGYFTNYPKQVLCILGNEFCERFSFYGMKAILVIYLWQALGLPKSTATAVYHAFLMISYFTPMLGAIIADSWIGKFKTILSVSILYAFGNVVMTATAIPYGSGYHLYGPIIGLILIAFGTGGIKPCVSSFGGDQFSDEQKRQKDSFFSLFYMAINVGSLLSTIITPMIRGGFYCFDSSCYSLAFGIPAALMVVAILFFVLGYRWYTKIPPSRSVITRIVGCVAKSLVRKCSKGCGEKDKKKEHWLDYAEPDYDKKFISEVRDALRVMWIFVPLPVFWALFDQQGSRWTLQATQMDGDFGHFTIQPDLIQVLNPLLVVLLVPLLESVVFRCFDKYHIPFRPLQRMGVGMLLAASSFIIAAGIQVVIDKEIPMSIEAGQTKVRFLNPTECDVRITELNKFFDPQTLTKFDSAEYVYFGSGNATLEVEWTDCGNQRTSAKTNQSLQFRSGTAYHVYACGDQVLRQMEQTKDTLTDDLMSTVRFFNALDFPVAINLTTTGGEESRPRAISSTQPLNESNYESLILANFFVDLISPTNSTLRLPTEIVSKNGAVYTVIIRRLTQQPPSANSSTDDFFGGGLHLDLIQTKDINPWSTNILLQIPQYVVITLGECLFSVTGLSFAYSQAPISMKSLLQAVWLWTVAFGNLIVIIVAESNSGLEQVYEFVLFAGLMYLTTFIFALMAVFYVYVDPAKVNETSSNPEESSAKTDPNMDDKESKDDRKPKKEEQRSELRSRKEMPQQENHNYEKLKIDDETEHTYM